MNDDFWNYEISKLADELVKKPDEFSLEKIFPCPVCHNQLRIQISNYQRGNAKMIGIIIECNACNEAVALDFIEG
jgi:transcription elongation factor Elf1